MKKVIMTLATAAVMLGATQSTIAQETIPTVESNKPILQMQAGKDYQPIEVENLPAAISESVSSDFEGATVTEAYVDEKQETYKIVLQIQGKDAQTVYATSDGEWIKPQE